MNPSSPPPNPQRLVFIVGLTIGLSILGDSFLYGNLPVEAENLGIALPLVGVLLSANRLVRLISNTWASSVFEKFGPRRPFIASTVLALITTALYGVGWGFAVFLLARMGWGIAWSALRQGGYQAVWAGGTTVKGKLMGLLWGMIRLGSAFSVVMGGYLRDLWGYRAGVLGVMSVSALAIPVAFSIRWPAEAQRISSSRQSLWQGWREALKTERGRRLLLAGSIHTLFEGVLIATASLFLARRLGNFDFLSGLGIRIGTIAGLLLALRWTSDILFAPGIGWMADRLGQLRSLVVLVCVLLVSLLGAVSISGPLLVLFLAFLFVSSAGLNVTLNAQANALSTQMERPHIYLGVYATAVDGGAAVGPLLAYSIGTLTGFAVLYLVIGGVLTLAIFQYGWPGGNRRLASH
ncbi:MAG: MFS transporter [Syntrophaceae bacterium]|nr:MFS transporter [Syntrophaceae bacterium]